MSQTMQYVGGWGARVPNKYMEFCPKNFSFVQKIKCSKQPQKQNKPNFHLSPSGVPNVRGGWVGSDVWDKVPKKTFFLTPSLRLASNFSWILWKPALPLWHWTSSYSIECSVMSCYMLWKQTSGWSFLIIKTMAYQCEKESCILV